MVEIPSVLKKSFTLKGGARHQFIKSWIARHPFTCFTMIEIMSYERRDSHQTCSLLVVPHWTGASSTTYSAAMEITCACSLWGGGVWQTFDIVGPRLQCDCRALSLLYICHAFTPKSRLPSLAPLCCEYKPRFGGQQCTWTGQVGAKYAVRHVVYTHPSLSSPNCYTY